MRVADVKLFWSKSPSVDVFSQRVNLTIDGVQATGAEFGPEVEEMMIEVAASQTVVFSVTTVDVEGNEAVSSSYTLVLGDLESPFPASNLGHAVVAIRDVVVE